MQPDGLVVDDVFDMVVVDNLSRTQIVQYAGASGDFIPLHTDEVYATEVAGFPSVFAHGMLTMALAGRLLMRIFGSENLTYFGGRFLAQVWPGDTLTAYATVISVSATDRGENVTVSLRVFAQDARAVFTGSAIAHRVSEGRPGQ